MSKELKVGAFVLSSAIIVLGTLAYVTNFQLRGKRIPFRTYVQYAGGVEPGSPVRFGGMKVGAITSIRPWRVDPTKIEILLEVRDEIPVNLDSTAMLTSISPLSDKYLEISTGTNKARRLTPGAVIPSAAPPVSLDDLAKEMSAIIPSIQSSFEGVRKDIDQLTGDAQGALANVQSMAGPQNQRNLTLLLANARELLDKESPRIERVLENLQLASSQASDALKEVHAAAGRTNDTIVNASRTIDEMREPFKADLTELHNGLADARRLMADLNTIVAANRYNIGDTLDNFRAASENLRDLTAAVKQRPWMLIRGKPAPDRAVPVVSAGR